jgi:hypothetical protein
MTGGAFDEGDGFFRDAAAIGERLGAPIWLARTRREWAEVVR